MNKSTLTLGIFAAIATGASIPIDFETDQIARKLIIVVRSKSADRYIEMFPTLKDFHQMMEHQSLRYGIYLKEAKDDFDIQYETKIVPEAKNAFTALIKDGEKRGIDWSDVQFVAADIEEYAEAGIKSALFTVLISSNGKNYRIEVDRIMYVNNEWKMSQLIKLDLI